MNPDYIAAKGTDLGSYCLQYKLPNYTEDDKNHKLE